MEPKRLVGPGAGALKYDVLTALAVAGMHGPQGRQVSMMRLMGLITARYNWREDEFCVGQREMARLWAVNERTVKREIKRWLEDRLIICKRPGVRGRVGAYRLNMPVLMEQTAPHWDAVGPDFAERMAGMLPRETGNVVRLRPSDNASSAELDSDTSPWTTVRARLKQLHPDTFRTWLGPLRFVSDDGRAVTLEAPSRFVASYVETHFKALIFEAIEAEIGPNRRVIVTAPAACN